MNILDTIIAHKRNEVAAAKERTSISTLEQSVLFHRTPYSLREHVLNPEKTGIIAEIKRQSPSKGVINANISVTDVAQGYESEGASAISVLTDEKFFGGNSDDLHHARSVTTCPILRKDFMVDEYQVIEAKSWGADAILLIASVLSPREIDTLGALAKSLGLSVLLEVHDNDELQKSISHNVDLIGVNNRNLKTFVTDVQTSLDLVDAIPNEFVKVSESGISDTSVIKTLKNAGYQGFLIGENFMKTGNPAAAHAFMGEL